MSTALFVTIFVLLPVHPVLANGYQIFYDDTPVPCTDADRKYLTTQVGCLPGSCVRSRTFETEFSCTRSEICCSNACGMFCFPGGDAQPAKREAFGFSLFPMFALKTSTTTSRPTTTTTTRRASTSTAAITSSSTITTTTTTAPIESSPIEAELVATTTTTTEVQPVKKVAEEAWNYHPASAVHRRRKLPACLEAWLEVQRDPSKFAKYAETPLCPPIGGYHISTSEAPLSEPVERAMNDEPRDDEPTTPTTTEETTTTAMSSTSTHPAAWKLRRGALSQWGSSDRVVEPKKDRPPRKVQLFNLGNDEQH